MARKVLGRGKNGMAMDCRLKINTRTRGIRCEPDGIPLLWLPHDKSWIPDLPKGSGNYRFGRIWDTWSGFKSKEMTPATLAPRILWLSTKLQLDWPRQEGLLLTAKSKNTSKCTEKKPNHRKNSIQLTNGVPQPKNRCPVLDRMKLSKTHP
jgi:hypothetical protein